MSACRRTRVQLPPPPPLPFPARSRHDDDQDTTLRDRADRSLRGAPCLGGGDKPSFPSNVELVYVTLTVLDDEGGGEPRWRQNALPPLLQPRRRAEVPVRQLVGLVY